MSSQIPYHLRTNKNVERTLFVDLLRLLSPNLPVPTNRYWYVGMGGPLLEDFSSVQGAWHPRRMISLEQSKHVLTRQRFNRPNSRTTLTQDTTGTFSTEYETGASPLLAWFDYTRTNWQEQITESCDLLRKLPDFSIFKISLACKITAWNSMAGVVGTKFDSRLAHLKKNFEAYGPFVQDDVRDDNFAATMYRILQSAIADAVPDRPGRVCRPLAAFTYSDGTQMLTVTVIVGPPKGVRDVIVKSKLSEWRYARTRWGAPIEISIPELSIRERLAIERLLPDNSPAKIHRKLRFRFADNPGESLGILSRYVGFARHVPYFAKIHH